MLALAESSTNWPHMNLWGESTIPSDVLRQDPNIIQMVLTRRNESDFGPVGKTTTKVKVLLLYKRFILL
jgi:hypothetical protein